MLFEEKIIKALERLADKDESRAIKIIRVVLIFLLIFLCILMIVK